MIHYLTIGILLGLTAGFSPGPLLTLVISETLLHGVKAGIKVAFAPVISDLPIILVTLFIASGMSGFQNLLGIVSIVGGIFILNTGYNCIRVKPVEVSIQGLSPKSLLKGVLTNILNPHPYLFWISVGAPTISNALNVGILAVAVFLGGFYLLLVGSKIVLAIVVGKSRSFLAGKVYINTLRILGLLLTGFAFMLFRDGAKLLGLY